ncbi:MAG: HAMP domain-containing sensor histidine kinase [Parcubacteria group bacterium]|jgi:signal transduction histidine kinase
MKSQINLRLVRVLRQSAAYLSLLIFCIGLLAIIGWWTDIEIFKRVFPSLPVIAPNSAVSFVAAGFSIFILSKKNVGSRLNYVVWFFSLFLIAVSFSTIIEYIAGINFGIDSILFSQKMGTAVVRMSPQSAINFLAVGISLFLCNLRTRRSMMLGQAVIMVAGFLALLSLFGFIYNLPNLYTISHYKGMAAHTAVAFVLIFMSTLSLRPDYGYMRIFVSHGISSLVARRLIFALLVLIVIEVLVMLGGKSGLYDYIYESIVHLFIVAGVFLYLIYATFSSLDILARAERDIIRIKEIDKAKTEFVSLASHQLRTPLTSVSWYAEMLISGDAGFLNPKQKQYLDEIYIGNRRMIDLVDDLLNASRIDMGTLVAEPARLDLRGLLDSLINEFAPLISSKQIEIVKKYDADIPPIFADVEHIRIVFQNLLSNAIKYTPEKGSVTVESQKKGLEIVIGISDTGYGIPKHQQAKIFTKLFRADNVRNKDTDGTGLGLYIARAIIKQSGGKIWFDSIENKGSTFFVSLPIKSH